MPAHVFKENFQWLVESDPSDLCADFDRFIEAVAQVENIKPSDPRSDAYKSVALRRTVESLKYLRVAHDID